MELSEESKNVVDKEFEIIDAIAKRILQKHKPSFISENYIKHSAIAIYLKRVNDLRIDDEDD